MKVMSAEKFLDLIRSAAEQIENDYNRARANARNGDPQRAGHESEAVWHSFIPKWFPIGDVVTRKYLVGPNGSTNEVDLVLLKPDYPKDLRNESSILVSGVAAAFSCKLTLKKPDLAEALAQKQLINRIAGEGGSTWPAVMTGPVPFGLLAQSTTLSPGAPHFSDYLAHLYYEVAHAQNSPLVNRPQEELDALLIADRGFWNTTYSSLIPRVDKEGTLVHKPMTAFMAHGQGDNHPGYPLVQFLIWLSTRCGNNNTSLSALSSVFGPPKAEGLMHFWELSIFPEHIQNNLTYLIGDFGLPKTVL